MPNTYRWYECHFCGQFFDNPAKLNTIYLNEWEKTRLSYPYHYEWDVKQVKVCGPCYYERGPK